MSGALIRLRNRSKLSWGEIFGAFSSFLFANHISLNSISITGWLKKKFKKKKNQIFSSLKKIIHTLYIENYFIGTKRLLEHSRLSHDTSSLVCLLSTKSVIWPWLLATQLNHLQRSKQLRDETSSYIIIRQIDLPILFAIIRRLRVLQECILWFVNYPKLAELSAERLHG